MLVDELESSHGVNLLLNQAQGNFQIALSSINLIKKTIDGKRIVSKSVDRIEKSLNDPRLVLSGVNWHEGIIGIVASRLKDKYNKPTILISIKDGMGKASARSIFGFDIGSLILSA